MLEQRVRAKGALAVRNDRSAKTSRFGWGNTPQGCGRFAEEHGSGMQVRCPISLKKKCSLHVHTKESPSLLWKHAPFDWPLTCLHRAYQEPPLVSAPLHSYPSHTTTPLAKHSISAQTCQPSSKIWVSGRARESVASPRAISSSVNVQ